MSGYVRYVKQSAKPISSRLRSLDIELTERCNNRCIHCYINQPENDLSCKIREMGTALVEGILKQAADLGCLSVRFTGGEPLLRGDFADLYLFARRLGLTVSLFTNARLVTPELAGLLARIPPGNPVEVSVYGMHADSYDAVAAVRGAFDQFWHGINLLRKYHVPFVVKQSILPPNRDEHIEFEDFAATLPDINNEPHYTMNFDLRARRDDPDKNCRIRLLRNSPEETLAMLTKKEPKKYFEEMRQFAAKFMRPPGDKLFSCGAGRGACIDAYGNAQMCMLLRHPATVYHMNQEKHQECNPETDLLPLDYVLTEFFPEVRQVRASDPEYLRRCAVCFLKGLCEQCPGKSWEEHGVLDRPVEYLCQIAHAQARFLGLVLETEYAWELEPEVQNARIKKFVE